MTLVLQSQGVSFRYAGQLEPLFTDVSAHLYAGDKVALLGHNGAGKTTLLRVLLGDLAATEGEVICSGRKALLRQEEGFKSGGSVLETLLASSTEHGALYRRMRGLEGTSDPLAYADALNDFAEAGGYDLLQVIEAEVDALGFTPEVLERSATGLSGGERRLLTLTSVFLQPADLLVLDEPTNYLDERATAYLIGKINAFAGACLVVSHDRWFLDQTVTTVWELEHRRLESYSGNYTTFRATKDALFRQKIRQKAKLETEVSKLEEIERTYKTWGARKEKEKSGAMDKGFVGARAAKLRKRAIQAKARRQDRIETLKEARPWVDKHYAIAFEDTFVPSGTCLVVRDVHFAYGNEGVIHGVSLTAEWGERFALRGENGSGKSTLIKLLLAQLTPDRGELLWSKGVALGYLPQLWQAPRVERAAELFGDEEAQEARTLLGALNVKGDAFYSPLESLSEGQKRKVSLVRLLMDKPNVLILDEPTTHLDYESVEMLEHALSNFKGTLLLVSHDRYLRERVIDREVVVF